MTDVTRLSALLLTVAVSIAACGGGGGATDDATAAADDAAAGAELYAANCAACHGQDLRGTHQGPPFLDDVYEPSHHGDVAFQLAVAQGVQPHHWDFGPMPAIPSLGEQQVTDITAYVRQQQRDAGIG